MSEQKRIAAYVSLVKALEGEKTHLSALAEAGRVAVATLQSERDANATLTADVARLSAALTEALAQLEAERARLDYLISLGAWVEWTMRDGSIRQCQVWTQNEEEEYIILTGDRFFNDERAAIDAAMSSTVISGDAS